MKKIYILLVLCILFFTKPSFAKNKYFGVNTALSGAQGLEVGVSIKPIDKFNFGFDFTHNYLSGGFLFFITADPIHKFISPSETFEIGHSFVGTDGLRYQNAYNFLSAQIGLEIGPRNSFRYFLRTGPQVIYYPIDEHSKIIPIIKTGFNIYFD